MSVATTLNSNLLTLNNTEISSLQFIQCVALATELAGWRTAAPYRNN